MAADVRRARPARQARGCCRFVTGPGGVAEHSDSGKAVEPFFMTAAPIPFDETARLAALRASEMLDSPPERAFDSLVELAGEICGRPIALMSLVDADRQWFKAVRGLDARETPRESAFCAHAILGDEIFEVPDATADPRFAENPLVVGGPDIRAYAGAVLHGRDGHRLGTLCVIDRIPGGLSKSQRTALRTLANQIETELQLRLKIADLRRVEEQKRQLSDLIVHDLKSPLTAIGFNAGFLVDVTEGELHDAATGVVEAADRMLDLITNLMDMSRGEHGELVARRTEVDVDALIVSTCAATSRRASARGCAVIAAGELGGTTATADPDLIRRMLDNLVDNALRYSPAGASVRVEAKRSDGELELRVRDEGQGVPAAAQTRIFDRAFQLDDAKNDRTTRGLGLSFCRMAAEAHGGRIWVEDNVPCGATFVVRIPRAA